MTKYHPLFQLHQLVQLTHSVHGKAIFYSQVNLAKHDSMNDVDEAGGWLLSAFTGKSYFEREYQREDLDELLVAAGDADWTSFAKRFKKAILDGLFHVVENNARECRIIVDNDLHSRTTTSGGALAKLETIEIDLYPISHSSRNTKMGDFMFEARGCYLGQPILGPSSSTHSTTNTTPKSGVMEQGGGNYEDLKEERDRYKAENSVLKQEVERLRATAGSRNAHSGIGSTSGRPKSKNGQMATMVNEQLLKKRKGASILNPRMKKAVVAKGTEFGSDEEEDE
ncbi:hypothetical protein BGW38_000442 [Lunasporangiospora selenospora]|uniref:Uncharacterized protein n=1 Tax=Lunasporangiospora selenospora TaxID=979761 RepID=A0A9P6FVH9_9FUNG|nr:hypothetical protein BGW38_000442 [Lunasporangiospora selenospora]